MNLKKKLIKICLSCVGGILIFDFINSLKNNKDFSVKNIGIDKDNNAHGKVLCDKFINICDPKEESRYIKKLVKILKEDQIDIFFPLSDKECEIVSKNIDYLKDKVKTNFWVGKSSPKNILINKEEFLKFCKLNKFLTEKYYTVDNYKKFKKYALKEKNNKLILKTLVGSGSKGVYLINKELRRNINILKGRNCYETNINFHKKTFNGKERFVLMPYFKGDFFDVDCIASEGKLLDFSIRKRNNKNQFLFYSTGHITVENSLIKKTIKNFILKAKIDGPCDFDVILKNKKVILMEASARLSGSVGICSKAGINFPAQAVRKTMKLNYSPMKLKKMSHLELF